eukprot:EG_transcript_50128
MNISQISSPSQQPPQMYGAFSGDFRINCAPLSGMVNRHPLRNSRGSLRVAMPCLDSYINPGCGGRTSFYTQIVAEPRFQPENVFSQGAPEGGPLNTFSG